MKDAVRTDAFTADPLPTLDRPWMLTGRDVYRMLVLVRGWNSPKYEDWLADALVRSLLICGKRG